MSIPYVPPREGDLAPFLANFASALAMSPLAYGVAVVDSNTMTSLNAIFQAAFTLASNPATRTAGNVANKDVAKFNAISWLRVLMSQIQGFPGITPVQLATLGLTVRNTGRTPAPPPATFPILQVVSNAMHSILMTISDQNTPAKRARPAGVKGCELYVSYGASAPTSLAGMSYVGLQTRFNIQWDLGTQNTGLRYWLVGRWINARGEPGPSSAPVTGIVT